MSVPSEDEVVFGIDTMSRILQNGSDSQRTIVLFEIQQLLDNCLDETLTVIVPVICQEVIKWSPEAVISAAEALLDVTQRAKDEATCTIVCDCAIQLILKYETNEMIEAWAEVLVVALPHSNKSNSDHIEHIVSSLRTFATKPNTVSRKFAARISGSLAACLQPQHIEKHLLEVCLILASDSNAEVRGMVVESLAFVGAAVSIQTLEKSIWPQLHTLLIDSDSRIHAAAIRTVARVLEARRTKNHGSALYKEFLEPVFLHECIFARNAASQDQRKIKDRAYLLLEIVSETYGSLLASVNPHLQSDLARKTAYKAYLAMATCNGPIIRRNCAGNLPVVAKALSSQYASEISSVLEFLARDSDVETRLNIAAGIHEVANFVGNKKTANNLLKASISLIKDTNSAVRTKCLSNLYLLLKVFNEILDDNTLIRLTPVLETLSPLSAGHWRNQMLLAEQIEKAVTLIPSHSLGHTVLPLLCQIAEESTYLVRKACMSAIAKCLWCIPTPDERQEAAQSFGIQWSAGGVFWMRISFLDCCEAAVEEYSRSLFRELFMSEVLRLVEDPVVNVRLRVARMIHLLAPSCSETEDFRLALVVLKADNDVDVREAMEGVEKRIAQVMLSGEAQAHQDMCRESAERLILDIYQRRRLEEKKKILRKRYRTPALTAMASLMHYDENNFIGKGTGAFSPRSIMATGKESVKLVSRETNHRVARRSSVLPRPMADDDPEILSASRDHKDSVLRAIASHPVPAHSRPVRDEMFISALETEPRSHRNIGRRFKFLALRIRQPR